MKRPFLSAALLALAAPALAAFPPRDWGARESALGGAAAASSDDASGLFWNPAGPARAEATEIFFTGQMNPGQPSDLRTNEGAASFIRRAGNGAWGAGANSTDLAGLAREDVFLLNLSQRWGPLALGADASYLRSSIFPDSASSSDPTFPRNRAASAWSADAGLDLDLGGGCRVGIFGRNLTRPDVGLAEKDPVAPSYQAGFHWKVLRRLSLSADVLRRDSSALPAEERTKPRVGMEWGDRNNWSLRAGMVGRSFSMGGGISLDGRRGLTVDYAALFPENAPPQYIASISWRFGPSSPVPRPRPSVPPHPWRSSTPVKADEEKTPNSRKKIRPLTD